MILELEDNDWISRCVIYKRAFDNTFRHIDSYLWQFGKTHDDGASHESAVLRRLAPVIADVHRIGCNIASIQNERGCNPPPGPRRRYYCGYRTARYGNLPRSGDGFSVKISHKPEEGQDAHLDVAVIVNQGERNAQAVWRTNAGMALAEQFGPVFPCICECDKADEFHPVNQFGAVCLGLTAENTEDEALCAK